MSGKYAGKSGERKGVCTNNDQFVPIEHHFVRIMILLNAECGVRNAE